MTSGNGSLGTKLLHQFRADRKRLPLHPLEKAVLTAVAVHLCFLPWALGTMHAWSQITSLVLATVGMLLALIPRNYSSDLSGGPAMRLTMWPRLLHFPIFWIGLALLGYIALQASNPSWVWERSETQWWLRRVNDIPWLPTSVDTPFERFDAWRQFIIYASAWLTVCTVWTGLTRRRALQILTVFLSANGAILAAVGLLLRFLRPPWFLLWFKDPLPGATSYASFINKNHAGAYLALLTLSTAALAMWYFDQGERDLKKSTPAGLFSFNALFLTGAVFFTLSRGASVSLLISLILFLIWFFLRRRVFPRPNTTTHVTVIVVLMFVSVLTCAVSYLDLSTIYRGFDRVVKEQTHEESVRTRLYAYKAGQHMLADHWQRGVGAGGFRYLFPEYIKRYPEAYANGQLFWEHAHNDWLEIPIELGVTGSALLLLAAGWWLLVFYRSRAIWHSLAIPILLGCGQTLIHAWADFPFQNPAILVTWLALIAIAARWLELEAP